MLFIIQRCALCADVSNMCIPICARASFCYSFGLSCLRRLFLTMRHCENFRWLMKSFGDEQAVETNYHNGSCMEYLSVDK